MNKVNVNNFTGMPDLDAVYEIDPYQRPPNQINQQPRPMLSQIQQSSTEWYKICSIIIK